uniref:protein-serine/threonine phosphatase n=2 Tax=Caenorhabditis elegans TaxID=6239 RepID=Q9XUM4_CAEEL|eukprot:NP_493420.1 Uncharacterized protein CELE_W04A8.1 [Caenorhabditis elegans]
MSIAYGFDPNISPIYDDDDDEHRHSTHFSSADTPKKTGRPSNRTMGTSIQISGDFSDLSSFRPENSVISEIVLDSGDEEEVPDSREDVLACDDDEEVPESVGYLAGTVIVLSAGCCLPIRHHLSKKLIEMGAEIQKTIDNRTTHIVVDRYADEKLVGEAMSRKPEPPMMVDVKWIQECLDNRQKCKENDFSMIGLRYLKQSCRRLSSFREPTPLGDEEETFWEDMENDAPTDPAKLLEQIRKLSERLDALMDCKPHVPVIRFEYHSPDCPTRQQPQPPAPPAKKASQRPKNSRIPSPEALQQLFTSISTSSTLRRRRSFTGFVLEHREPGNAALEVQEANNDVRNTWNPELGAKKPRKTRKAPQKTVNDMRKTMAADLTTIRDVLAKNSDLNRARTPKKSKKPAKNSNSRQKMMPVHVDDSDIQSALASLTISEAPRECSVQILVPTRSNVINQLQKRHEEDDDDFISDVSAFLQRKTMKKSRNLGENSKNEVIFTGSPIEKKLKTIVRRFKMTISTEIDEERTLCVVSRHGKRTLLVLRAICCDVPIVRPQWLEESFEDSQLLPSSDYIYQEWLRIENLKIFANFHLRMWIAPECTPDSADLAWMIEKCGGKVTRHLHRADLVIAPENWEIPAENDVEFELATPLFVIDSISMAELQNFREYSVII